MQVIAPIAQAARCAAIHPLATAVAIHTRGGRHV
jgi:hypothetical protein